MKKNIAIIALTILLFTQVPFVFAQAQSIDEKSQIEVSPQAVDKSGKPGDTLQTTIIVTNHAKTPMFIQSYAEDFYVTQEGDTKIVTKQELDKDPELKKFSIGNWVKTTGLDAKFKPEESRKVPVYIDLPKDATPGGHYGILFFAPGQASTAAGIVGSGASLQGEVGSLLNISVAGDYSQEGAVEKFRTGTWDDGEKKFNNHYLFWNQGVFEKSKIDFGFNFINSSITHQIPQGFITISNFSGSKIDEIPIAPTRVFPRTTRDIHTRYEQELLPGIYNALLVTKDADGRSYDLKTKFIVFPLRVILIILGAIGLMVLVAWSYGRYIERKYKRESVKTHK